MARSVVQRNNGGPKGYGQPEKKNMRSALMRPEDEAVFGQAPDEGEMRLTPQEEAPSVYPAQPQYRSQPKSPYELKDEGVSTGATGPMAYDRSAVASPQFNPNLSNYTQRNTGVAGGVNRGQAEQATGAVGGALGGMFGQGGHGGKSWKDIGTRPQAPQSGQSPLMERVQVGPVGPDGLPTMTQVPASDGWQQRLNQSTQGPGNIAAAAQTAMDNGYTDIEGAQGYFTPGQFQSQLAGFNTNGWNTGERGTQTLKNTMGQLFSNYDVSQPGALSRVVQDPKLLAMYPQATIVPHANEDLLDLDGEGPMQPIDVIQGATAGGAGQAWAWQPQDGSGGQPQTGGPGGPSAMAYQAGLPGMGQQQQQPGQMPEVMDQQSAMDFLNWLMAQQGQGMR